MRVVPIVTKNRTVGPDPSVLKNRTKKPDPTVSFFQFITYTLFNMTNNEISLIVAYAKNRVIGNNHAIPWNIPGEQKRFKELTTGNVVIMGRHTFEEIFKKLGHALPNRTTIVVSKSQKFEAVGCITASSFGEAFRIARKNFYDKDVFICGGASIYREALPVVEKMYITEVELEVEGDAYFPDFMVDDFKITKDEHFDGEIPYTYYTYTRKSRSDYN